MSVKRGSVRTRVTVVTSLAFVAGFAGAQESRVFVASEVVTGNLGGLSGADATCQRLGAAVDSGAIWIAWLSTSTVNAYERLGTSSGPFVRAFDGARIAKDIADLTDGSLENKIGYVNEPGQGTQLGDHPVWTGTGANGTLSQGGHDCGGWTSEVLLGSAGGYWTSSSAWTDSGEPPLSCGQQGYIYCFEVVKASALPSIKVNKTHAEVAEPITATLNNVPSGPGHWIALATAGSTNQTYLAWEWVAKLTGQPQVWQQPMPTTPGDYVFRLFLNGGYDLAAASQAVSVKVPSVPPTIEAPPTSARGGTIKATLLNAPRGTSYWIALAVDGSDPSTYLKWNWVTALTGDPKTWSLTMPTDPGTYVFRLFLPAASGAHELVATSDTVEVP